MMTLKPYLSLQKIGYPHTKEGEEFYYVGLAISVPENYIIYVREPEKVIAKGEEMTPDEVECYIQVDLYRARTMHYYGPQEFLIGLDTALPKWKGLNSVRVEIHYRVMDEPHKLVSPHETEGESKCIAFCLARTEDAGSLLAEEGLLKVLEEKVRAEVTEKLAEETSEGTPRSGDSKTVEAQVEKELEARRKAFLVESHSPIVEILQQLNIGKVVGTKVPPPPHGGS